MGVLIVIAFVLLGIGFYVRITDPDFRLFKAREPEAAVSAVQHDVASGVALPSAGPAAVGHTAGFGDVQVRLPAGCTLVEMRPDGPWLYLRTGPAGACERIWVIEVRTGRTLGSLGFAP